MIGPKALEKLRYEALRPIVVPCSSGLELREIIVVIVGCTSELNAEKVKQTQTKKIMLGKMGMSTKVTLRINKPKNRMLTRLVRLVSSPIPLPCTTTETTPKAANRRVRASLF